MLHHDTLNHTAPSRTRTRTRVTATAVAVVALSASCSFESADTEAQVFGTDDACTLATAELDAGKIDFRFTNNGSDVSELYVLLPDGDVVGEVENVTSGTTRTLTVDLVAGEYQIQCKPGQSGDGISAGFSVTGAGGTPQAAPDLEIGFEAVDFDYEQLDLSAITAGSTVRFAMVNAGNQPHEFEVLDPDGEAIGEVASTESGQSRGANMTFEQAGLYSYQCILVDPSSDKPHTELGMKGAFEVPAT